MITNPTPQRALRGHMPQRPTPRAATTGAHHAQLAGRLTPRDRWLARMLHEHKVFTTQQFVEMAFPTTRAANHRLLDLFKWRVVDRFQPFVTSGTAPMHYVLDIAGAVALAYEDGLDPKKLGYRHEDAVGIAHSLRLAHTVGVNGFFSTLVALSQRPGARGRLTAWWSELRCGRHFGDMARPDAYGRWREDGHEIEFFLEFDFGTEDLGTLASKLSGYEKLATTTGITTPVLVWLPTNRRETTARRALTDALSQLDRPTRVPVATSAADVAGVAGENNPAVARWLPISGPAARRPGRLRLVELALLWPHTDTAQTNQPSTQPSTSTTSRQAPAELAAPAPLPPRPPTTRFRR
ncbi:replication-relaxation family protein [Kibdelosporangium philippinense]|uniref:Replication-relaxation family protein n=1 Tax=Kibdelosporangium philippinense TaxID=211113 RepID=A0ABS8ZVD4_9PSEU|nr:replication-relaxation family protein [Kibdelosporangium philippinense]MCE7011689.1 replication-relaxation family protein [Kibdelosporangium philippinense]